VLVEVGVGVGVGLVVWLKLLSNGYLVNAYITYKVTAVGCRFRV